MSKGSKVLSFSKRKLIKPDPVELAARLGTPVRLKTWSLIVTFFGDAVLARGGSISALSLGQVIEATGLEAGAIRTAVSRLASDGWIERERQGRASFYRLATYREKAFQKAAELIYARPDKAGEPGNWALGVLPGDLALEPQIEKHTLVIQKGWLLLDLSKIDRSDLPAALMLFEGRFVQKPAWFLELLAPQELGASMERLIDVFHPVLRAMEEGWQPTPLEALSIRTLLIHEWRRIALRLHRMPSDLLPADWPESKCRVFTSELYKLLFAASEAWLDNEAFCLAGKLPAADATASIRFI